jgi:replicative DNA helicase
MYSIEHERAVLGIIIKCNDLETIFDIVNKLKAEAFYEPKHQVIYKSIIQLLKSKTMPDIINLPEVMRDKNKLNNIGGMEYLIDLTTEVSSISNYKHYVDKVKDLFIKREFIRYAQELEKKVEPIQDNSEIFDFSMSQLKAIYNLNVEDKIESVAKIHDRVASKKIRRIFNTGFDFIDKSHTVEPGRFFLLAGKEKIGKTTFALNLIVNVLQQAKTVLFYSCLDVLKFRYI